MKQEKDQPDKQSKNKLKRICVFLKKTWRVFAIFMGLPFMIGAMILGAVWWINSITEVVDDPSIGTVKSIFKELSSSGNKENNPPIDCSNVLDKWRPGQNTYFDDENKIKLKKGRAAGAIFLKDKVSSFLALDITFRSSLQTGINTNISFKNDDGELKYAIGDGDFKTIRYSYNPNNGIIDKERTILPLEIDNSNDIGFKVSIIEGGEDNKVISSLTYYDTNGKFKTPDLKNMIIPNPQKIYLVIGFGLDARREPQNKDVYIEIISCKITESSPSKIFNR